MSAKTYATETARVAGEGGLDESVVFDIAALDGLHWHVIVDGQDAACFVDRWDATAWVYKQLESGAAADALRAARGPACVG